MGLLQSRNRLIGGYTEEEEAAFIQAVRNGNTAIVEQLLLDNPDIVNAREEEFPEEIELEDVSFLDTALIIAIKDANIAMVELLLAQPGIDVNATADDGWTALMWAAYQGTTIIIDNEFDEEERVYQPFALGSTQMQNGPAIVRLLLAHPGIDVNAEAWGPDLDNKTALMIAAEEGNLAIVRLLLAADGIDLSNALSGAVRSRNIATVKQLLAAGADVNAASERDWTALIQAAWDGEPEIVEALIDNGADVNATIINGVAALQQAIASRGMAERRAANGVVEVVEPAAYTAIVEQLLEAGADVNAANEQGWTALIRAASQGDTAIVELLLEAGADATAISIQGFTAASAAERFGHPATARVIKNFALNRSFIPRNRDMQSLGEFYARADLPKDLWKNKRLFNYTKQFL